VTKISKEEAHYRDNESSGDRCASCKTFIKVEGPKDKAIKPGKCVKVRGDIYPRGSCKLFKRGYGSARDPSTGQVRH
jgi:hypothetical protein